MQTEDEETNVNELLARAVELIGRAAEISSNDTLAKVCHQANDRLRIKARPIDFEPALALFTRLYYNDRRLRRRVFSEPAIFGEPAWDILLDLANAEIEGRRVSVSSACIAADVPPTTALRWLAILEDRELILREKDDLDSRRTFVKITGVGLGLMREYFQQVRKSRDTESIMRPPAS